MGWFVKLSIAVHARQVQPVVTGAAHRIQLSATDGSGFTREEVCANFATSPAVENPARLLRVATITITYCCCQCSPRVTRTFNNGHRTRQLQHAMSGATSGFSRLCAADTWSLKTTHLCLWSVRSAMVYSCLRHTWLLSQSTAALWRLFASNSATGPSERIGAQVSQFATRGAEQQMQ